MELVDHGTPDSLLNVGYKDDLGGSDKDFVQRVKSLSIDKGEIEGRIRRNSQSLGQIIPVEMISDESFEKMSPNSKKRYLLNKRCYSIESAFSSSKIIVTDCEIKEVDDDNNIPSPTATSLKRVSSYGIVF